MTKYYLKWTINPLAVPKSPEEQMKFWQSALEAVKADMKAGIIKDWGVTFDMREFYAIEEFANETEFAAYNLKWISALNLDAKPVLTVDQCLEISKKAMASMKK